jgi:pyruvate/2-oxoacid:ferredoxin oxidoreductase beta subunit
MSLQRLLPFYWWISHAPHGKDRRRRTNLTASPAYVYVARVGSEEYRRFAILVFI